MEIIFVPGTSAITADYYGVTISQPVRVRVPLSAIESEE